MPKPSVPFTLPRTLADLSRQSVLKNGRKNCIFFMASLFLGLNDIRYINFEVKSHTILTPYWGSLKKLPESFVPPGQRRSVKWWHLPTALHCIAFRTLRWNSGPWEDHISAFAGNQVNASTRDRHPRAILASYEYRHTWEKDGTISLPILMDIMIMKELIHTSCSGKADN